MNEILKAERLSKTYGKSIAVSEVSLTVRQGDIYGLIGKNGAGKTTFMRMVLGLASPDSGQMELFGKTDLEQQRKHIGMGAGGDVLQETGISGMAEQFAGGGLVTMFSAIFLCIWVISDYTHGAMKNVVGKGYSRVQVFLAKHLFGTLITALMNLIVFLVILIIGLILIGTQHVGSLFFQNLFLCFGLQLIFGVAVSSIVIAVCEWSRNMAAGIGITMALIIFSPLLMQGLDLLLSAMQLKIAISGYWILNLMADCPTEAFTSEFLFRGIFMAAVWTLLSLGLSVAHFRNADIE